MNDETKEAAVRGGAPAALREALERIANRVDNYCGHCEGDLFTVDADPLPSGEPGDPRQRPCLDSLHAAADDIRLLSENTVDSLDELDVDRLAEALHDAMCIVSHHDRPPARCGHWPKYPLMARSTASRYRRLTATAASDASEEETNG